MSSQAVRNKVNTKIRRIISDVKKNTKSDSAKRKYINGIRESIFRATREILFSGIRLRDFIQMLRQRALIKTAFSSI